MKKILKTVLSFAVALCMLLSLGAVRAESAAGAKPAKRKVVTTIFPQYDFVRQIAGDKVDLTLLLKPGSDSHSYELSPQDVKEIESADLFIYTGGEEDKKFEDLLASLGDKAPKSLRLTDMVKTLEEEVKEGMTHEHHHGEEEQHHEDEDHEHHDHDHEESAFTREDVEQRPLSEFAGEWRNVSGFVKDGAFDKIAEQRKGEGETAEDYKNKLMKNFGTDFDYLNITAEGLQRVVDGKVTEEAKYTADGIFFKEEDGHLHAAYQYRKTEEGGSLPSYILISDHKIKANQERGDNPHFHFMFSNESYEKAYESESSPMFVKASHNQESLEAWLLAEKEEGHDHDHEHDHDKDKDHDHEHDHDKDHDHDHEHEHSHSHELDEHVWTSPDNAKAIVEAIAKELAKMDSANADLYTENYKAYNKKLDALEEALEDVVKNAKRKLLVFGDRFPFRYLVESLGLDYYAAFPGCSADTEVSAQTVAFLIDKVKENKLPVVLKIELTDARIAETIAEATGAKVLTLNSCHNLSAEEFAQGKTFLDLMQANVEVLKEALQ